jgi:ectoine hydroxylase-related dioxygenase (phytanoyl-CoA dioxygenase family)
MTATSLTPPTIADRITHDGWAVTEPCVPQLVIDRLLAEIEPLEAHSDSRGGVRNLFEAAPSVRTLAASAPVREVAEAVLGERCFAVRALLFDKTPTANWKVVWHQDLTIAVRARAVVRDFGPWSEKAGVPHVQPPVDLLERMLAVRVHLDDCGVDNGPLRVIPGSHLVGRLTGEGVDAYRIARAAVDCVAQRGAIVALRPLLLHASSAAARPSHRRVVHFEFAAERLPEPLEWHEEVA